MKKNLSCTIAQILLVGMTATAQSYQPIDSLSQMKFIIKNVGMETEGRFSGLQGRIVFNPADLKTASFSVSIDAASINTDIEPRDMALREPEYLDTKNHPRISFEAKQVVSANKAGSYLMKGIISIKGTSKEISFPFQAIPKDDGLFFTGEMKLRRRDFKIGMSSIVLSEGFTVVLSVFAGKIQ